MADFSVTIVNGLPMLGMSPTSGNWNAVTWNAFLWGYTLDLPIDVLKGLAESNTPTTALGKYTEKGIDDTTTLGDDLEAEFVKLISESFTLVGDLTSQTLRDSSGYYHVFHSDTTEAEDRDFPTWTAANAQTASWVVSAASSTVWS